jgi:hypothetical protein
MTRILHRGFGPILLSALALSLPSSAAIGQANGDRVNPIRLPSNAAVVPFFVGEKLEYEVKFGAIKVGKGSMEVRDIADVRGVPSWHTIFRITGGIRSTG